MRRRAQFAIAVLLAVIAWVIVWQVLRERQPVYQGRTLLSWLWQHAKSSTPSGQGSATREAAEIAIHHIGTNGLPTLLAWAGQRDSPFKKKVLALMSEDMRFKAGVLSANDFRAGASYGFGVLNSIAKPAVPKLIQLLNDSDPSIRSGAAHCLCRIGPAAEESVPALLRRLDDPEAQSNAFAALRSIGVKPDLVVPALIGYLSSTNMGQQGWALSCLSAFGGDAKAAVPKVRKLLNDPQSYLRRAATNALKTIDPEEAVTAGGK